MTKPADSLDSLLESALIEHGNTLRGRRSLRTPGDYNSNYRASFTRPENWLLKRQVHLTHEDGSVLTLIGLFDELVHISVPGCRRLTASTTCRLDLPLVSELVQGEHWLPSERFLLKRLPSERTLELIHDLALEMGQQLTAQAVLLQASLVGGGLQRLVLLADTVFEGHAPRTILSLPKGLDILEGLSHICKAAVWRSMSGDL